MAMNMNENVPFGPFDLYLDSLYVDVSHICGVCGAGYVGIPWGGYCDESLSCACDDGMSLVVRVVA